MNDLSHPCAEELYDVCDLTFSAPCVTIATITILLIVLLLTSHDIKEKLNNGDR
jgi:hypothetical protein